MRASSSPAASGKFMATVVSVVGLLLVWGLVWANLPAKDLLAPSTPASPSTKGPELDLTIPGLGGAAHVPSGVPTAEAGRRSVQDFRARQIAELKCEAEAQQVCPGDGDDRRRCLAQRLRQFREACQPILRQQLVRWKQGVPSRAACAEDADRLCAGVEPGDGRMLQCLQERAAELSDACYRTLPKGQLLYQR